MELPTGLNAIVPAIRGGKVGRKVARALAGWAVVCHGLGCASTTLTRPADFRAVVSREPSSIALADIQDHVACDDEAFYLQRYLEGQRVFYDCVLADRSDFGAYHGADLIVSGKIEPTFRSRRLGWGVFASWITLGGYYVLGGPTRAEETHIAYAFEVRYADSGRTQTYEFTDVRKASFGLYGPGINLDQKPGIYDPGWERLLYEICRETRNQRAGRVP
jgi:hypothetical protein